MAEVLAIIGATSAIMDISVKLFTTVRKLRKHVKSTNAAPEDVRYFLNECIVFANILESFAKISGSLDISELQIIRRGTRKAARDVVKLCQSVVISARQLAKTFCNLRWNEANVWVKVRCWLHWQRNKPNMALLRHHLLSSQNSLQLLLALHSFERDAERALRTEGYHRGLYGSCIA